MKGFFGVALGMAFAPLENEKEYIQRGEKGAVQGPDWGAAMSHKGWGKLNGNIDLRSNNVCGNA
jgi:hypothetical protein